MPLELKTKSNWIPTKKNDNYTKDDLTEIFSSYRYRDGSFRSEYHNWLKEDFCLVGIGTSKKLNEFWVPWNDKKWKDLKEYGNTHPEIDIGCLKKCGDKKNSTNRKTCAVIRTDKVRERKETVSVPKNIEIVPVSKKDKPVMVDYVGRGYLHSRDDSITEHARGSSFTTIRQYASLDDAIDDARNRFLTEGTKTVPTLITEAKYTIKRNFDDKENIIPETQVMFFGQVDEHETDVDIEELDLFDDDILEFIDI